HLHRERQRLQNNMVALTIRDHARQSIALAPDNATKPRIDSVPRPIFRRLRDSALEKIEIEVLFPARKSARYDLRFAVVDRAAEQPVFSILQRNHIAISRIAKHLQHFSRE